MTAFVTYDIHHSLPPEVIKVHHPTNDPDIAFLNYIIECFELRTNIRPTVFIRNVPQEFISTIHQIIHNISNALTDIPVIIPTTQHQIIENTTTVFESHTLRKTEKPTIFGINLLALLKQVPVANLRAIRNYFIQHNPDNLGFFWFNIVGKLSPTPNTNQSPPTTNH